MADQKDVRIGGLSLGNHPFMIFFAICLFIGVPSATFYFNYQKNARTEHDRASDEIATATERTILVASIVDDIEDLKSEAKANTDWREGQVKVATRRVEGHRTRDARITTLENADMSKEQTITAIRDWILAQDKDAEIPPIIYVTVHPESYNKTASDEDD